MVLRLALQDEQGRVEREAPRLLLGAADHEGLIRREVVRQAGQAGRQLAGVLQLGREKLDGIRQARDGQDFLVDAREHVLRGHALGQAVAQDAEEIGLFDVFFAFEDGGGSHAVMVAGAGRPR